MHGKNTATGTNIILGNRFLNIIKKKRIFHKKYIQSQAAIVSPYWNDSERDVSETVQKFPRMRL